MLRSFTQVFLTISIFLVFSFSIFGQIKYNASAETGIFRSTGLGNENNVNVLASADGLLGYQYHENKRSASVQLRVRPELYGLNNNLRSLKFKASAWYYQEEKKFNWGININRQLFDFKSDNIDVSYDQFILSGNVSTFLTRDMPIVADIGYSFQKVSSNQIQKLDMTFVDARAYDLINTFLKLGYGFYAERFFLTGTVYSLQAGQPNYEAENNGWRIGPHISINYLKDFVVNFDYRFLIHNSQYTSYPSTENWLRLVVGKILSEKWSAFLLTDYYFRNFKTKEIAADNQDLLYTSTNFENRIYLKLGYDISNNIELYAKSGYFDENISVDKYSFEGLDVSLGIEIGN